MKFRLATNTVAVVISLASFSALALDADGQSLMRMLKEGTTPSIRQAAQIIVQQRYRDPEVLDYAYGLLQQRYASAGDRPTSDALAWVCKALASSRDNKYLPVIEEAARSGNPALEKHCGRAATDLGSRQRQTSSRSRRERARDAETAARATESKASAAPVAPVVATAAAVVPSPVVPPPVVNRQSAASPARPVQTSANVNTNANAYSSGRPIAGVAAGMSQAQVERLLGPATTFTYSLVGKAVEQGDSAAASYGLYQGRGIVVYTVDPVTFGYTVMTAVADGSETGYP